MIGNVAIFPTADILMTDPTVYTNWPVPGTDWLTVKSYSVIQDLNQGSGFRWITQLIRVGGAGQVDARLLLNGVTVASQSIPGAIWSADLTADAAGLTNWVPISTIELQIKGSAGAAGAQTRNNRLCGAYSPFLM
jgi:hypothetical protein